MRMLDYISKAKKRESRYKLLILITVIIKYIHTILTITKMMSTIKMDNYENDRKYNYVNFDT